MPTIVALSADSDPSPVQSLFREYGEFLRLTHSCGYFSYTNFQEEIAALPAHYTAHNGEILLASIDHLPEASPAACIAYRDTPADPATCEIKRLYVRPAFRNQGLARALVTEALARAEARNFTRVILDTDTATMPGALALYLSFGFREYGPRDGSIAFFERS